MRSLIIFGIGHSEPHVIVRRIVNIIDYTSCMALIIGESKRIKVAHGVEVAATVCGEGPPVLLLHGYPQTQTMWHRVVPALVGSYTVVTADLRGYGDSSKPAGELYSKREMATDQLTLMQELGWERFAVVGHDRGARVAHRMALDAPDRIAAVGVLDIMPTHHMFTNVDRAMATGYFHWFFLTQPHGLPERLIRAAPEAWLNSRFAERHRGDAPFDPRALDEYARCFVLPGTIEATCADYRAAATVDFEQDRADHEAGRRIDAPTLVLWGSHSYVGRNFDVGTVWSEYADGVEARAVEADHYVAEEAPDAVAEAIHGLLSEVWT